MWKKHVWIIEHLPVLVKWVWKLINWWGLLLLKNFSSLCNWKGGQGLFPFVITHLFVCFLYHFKGCDFMLLRAEDGMSSRWTMEKSMGCSSYTLQGDYIGVTVAETPKTDTVPWWVTVIFFSFLWSQSSTLLGQFRSRKSHFFWN